MSDRTDQAIIIKKNKKGGGEGHGGSWKVAYADFITSMMAVFLLLWLLNMTSAQKKVALSQYFQNHSIFEKGGGTAVGRYADVAGDGVLDSNSITPAIAQRTFVTSDIAKKIKEQVQSKTKEFNDRVFVFEDSGNLRIELTDTAGSSIFKVGSTELSESGKALIQEIAPVFTSVPNKIIIEGHTDSLGYKSNVFTNWELSTQRASAARIELEEKRSKASAGRDGCRLRGYQAPRPRDPRRSEEPAHQHRDRFKSQNKRTTPAPRTYKAGSTLGHGRCKEKYRFLSSARTATPARFPPDHIL